MDNLVTWSTKLANSSAHSDVYVMTVFWRESDLVGGTTAAAFNTEIMKVCAMGVTVVAPSGTDGAPGITYRSSTSSKCGYDALFPASSPYVTAVGATMGIEVGDPEVVCQSDLGGIRTSGGGFSALFPAFAEQKSAISGYFSKVSTAPYGGYSSGGRGYPDVAIAAKNLIVVYGGHIVVTSGILASIVAGMVTLINAARKASGRPSLGWLNPSLYANQGTFANDITSGNNKCTSNACCDQGYYAAPGWDPVTGFGSIDFKKLYTLLVSDSVPTASPTPSTATLASTGQKMFTSHNCITIRRNFLATFLEFLRFVHNFLN